MFIQNARKWYRYWSNRLALVAGVAAVWAVDNRVEVLQYVEDIPSPWRQAVTFLFVAVLPITVRMMAQTKLENSDGV